MQVHVKSIFTIRGKIAVGGECKLPSYNVNQDGILQKVVLFPNESKIEVYYQSEMTEEDFEKNKANQFSQITQSMFVSAVKVIELLKYFYNNYHLDGISSPLPNNYWSTDGKEWHSIKRNIMASIDVMSLVSLDEQVSDLQTMIDADMKPLMAMKHLHRARNESDPRFKWIDATIAAELAIKEFLCIQKPELKTMLMELPSPPLDKLYGKILIEYAGVSSPKVKQLGEGATIRNKLIHRPSVDLEISDQKAIKYVQDVETAIFHLLTLLYENNPVVKRLYSSISITAQ